MRNFIMYTHHKILLELLKPRMVKWAGKIACIGHMKMHKTFYFKILKRDH